MRHVCFACPPHKASALKEYTGQHFRDASRDRLARVRGFGTPSDEALVDAHCVANEVEKCCRWCSDLQPPSVVGRVGAGSVHRRLVSRGCESPHTRKPVARGVTEVLSSVFLKHRRLVDLPADGQAGYMKNRHDAVVQVPDSIG